MVRNNFLFFKNIKFNYLNMLFFESFNNNFIFFNKTNKVYLFSIKFVKIKKINFNKKLL